MLPIHWYGSQFKYAVVTKHHTSKPKCELFETEKEALKYAKLLGLYNSAFCVVGQVCSSLEVKVIWKSSDRKVKLVKVKDNAIDTPEGRS